MALLIAVTGGIGSGKSAVCRTLSLIGYRVYDCDSRARRLMDNDTEIHRLIARDIAPGAICDGTINRKYLASIVFADRAKLDRLNEIVHERVIADIQRWHARQTSDPILFIETAILIESNLHTLVDEVWLVDAPQEIRLRRACQRDNATPDEIRARMGNQTAVEASLLPVDLKIIDNDGTTAIFPQITRLLNNYNLPIPPAPQWRN